MPPITRERLGEQQAGVGAAHTRHVPPHAPTRAAALARGVMIAAFAWGTFTHAADWWHGGWWPYRFGPALPNVFWNALVLLDAVTLALLSRRPRTGLVAAIALMIADVAINTYAWQVLGLERFAVGVTFQAAFLGFVLGAAPLVWLSASTARRRPTG